MQKSIWFRISIWNLYFDLIFIPKIKFKCGLKLRRWFKLELATMGLVDLGEISPSLKDSNKIMKCSYEKFASPPRWDFT